MATNIVTPSNSTNQIVDDTANPFLLVTEGAYIANSATSISPAYWAKQASGHYTVKGTIMAVGDGAMVLGQGSNNSNGGHSVVVAASGVLQGYNGIDAYGGNNQIANAGLIQGNGLGGPALYLGGNSNIVTNSGTITGPYGVDFFQGNSETVVNSGLISGTINSVLAFGSLTIKNSGALQGDISATDLTLTNTNTITADITTTAGSFYMSNSGTIHASNNGFKVSGGVLILSNSGTIRGNFRQLTTDGASSVTNDGIIDGSLFLGDGVDTVDNTGTVSSIYAGGGSNSVTNFATGSIGYLEMAGSSDDTSGSTLENYGKISSSVSFGAGADSALNYGILSGVFLGDDGDIAQNYGTLGNAYLGAGSDYLFNGTGGTILVNVNLGTNDSQTLDTSADVFINNGVVGIDLANYLTGPATVICGDGADKLTNTGTIYGAVALNGGDDIFDNHLGTITGIVDLGAGDDTFTGGAGIDLVQGGLGADTITLGAGDDTYFAGYSGTSGDGIDDVDGGDGIDTYDAHLVTANITIDLDNSSTAGGRINNDKLVDFENAIGGTLNDTLLGSDGDNKFWGNAGNDTIKGGDGRDRMFGGSGADTLTGGAGRDILSGGSGNYVDTFVYTATGDSGLTGSTRDQINDFVDAGTFHDIINLNAIDANTTAAGNQAFNFIATAAFSNVAGQLRYEQLDSVAVIYGDINGDSKADFSIALRGTHTLTASDFTL